MNNRRMSEAFILGVLLCIGLTLLGYLISGSIIQIKALNRTVTVKGLNVRSPQILPYGQSNLTWRIMP